MMNVHHPKAAVIGWPINHSLSPRLHGYWLKHYNIAGSYEALPVEPHELEQRLHALRADGYAGVNLTVPHKELALKMVDRCDAIAQRVGAVNTIQAHPNGELEGYNTDVFGFRQNLESAGFDMRHRPVVILGAGGAARAAVIALQDMQVPEIRLINRTRARAEALAHELGREHSTDIRVYDTDVTEALAEASLLVNATSLGLKGVSEVELDLARLPPDATVTDMVYAPLMTGLLMRAQQRGHRVIDGLGMLLHQARPAFALFFGRDPAVTPELRAYVLAGRG